MTSSAPEDRRDIENEVAAFLPGVLLDLAVDESLDVGRPQIATAGARLACRLYRQAQTKNRKDRSERIQSRTAAPRQGAV